MRGKGFFKGGNIDNWGLLICSRYFSDDEARNFCNSLAGQAKFLGMKMSPKPTQIVYYSERRKTLHQTLTDLHKPNMKILLVILDGGLYGMNQFLIIAFWKRNLLGGGGGEVKLLFVYRRGQ